MSEFNLDVTPDIVVRKSTLYVCGKAIAGHDVLEKIGQGANGIVFRARSNVLGRDEALKVWFPKRKGDKRDRLQQGVQEAVKLAKANGKHAVQIQR